MPRTVPLDQLDDVRIASPCPMDWDRMEGDEQRRFCGHCGLHVYNLSAMSREEATLLLSSRESGERVCARLYRRADGTVLTRDCPVGVAAARARLRRVCGRVAAAIGLLLSGAWVFGRGWEPAESSLARAEPFVTVRSWLRGPTAPPLPQSEGIIMGVICPPPTPSGNGAGGSR